MALSGLDRRANKFGVYRGLISHSCCPAKPAFKTTELPGRLLIQPICRTGLNDQSRKICAYATQAVQQTSMVGKCAIATAEWKKWKLYLQGANHINRTLQVQQHRAVFHYDHCFSAQQSALIEKWKWKAYWNILQVRQHWPALQKFSQPPKTPFRDHFGMAWKTWENVFSRYNNTEMWVTCTATWVIPQWNYFWWQFFCVPNSQL